MTAVVCALGVLVAAAAGRAAVLVARRDPVRRRMAEPDQEPRPLAGLLGRGRAWWARRPSVSNQAIVESLPGVLDEVARHLRSGASLRQALTDASRSRAPAAGGLAAAVAQAGLGVPLDQALASWPAAVPLPQVRLAAGALGLVATAGGQAARAVDGVAQTLREQRAAQREVAAQAVQARSSALVIALLPVAFALWCLATDERAAAFLLASPAGWACLAGGIALLATGVWWMHRLIRAVS